MQHIQLSSVVMLCCSLWWYMKYRKVAVAEELTVIRVILDIRWLGGITVRTLDLRSKGPKFNS